MTASRTFVDTNVAAQAGRCTRLLTEDLSHGATYGSVVVENSFREA